MTEITRPATSSTLPSRKHRRFTTSLLSAFNMSESQTEWDNDTISPLSGAGAMWVSQPHLQTATALTIVEDSAFEGENTLDPSTAVPNLRPGSMFVAGSGGARTRSKWSLDGISQNVKTIARRASHSMRSHILPRHRKSESTTTADDLAVPISESHNSQNPTSPTKSTRRSSFFRSVAAPSSRTPQSTSPISPTDASAAPAGSNMSSSGLHIPNPQTLARHPSFDISAGAGARAAAAASRPIAPPTIQLRPVSTILPSRKTSSTVASPLSPGQAVSPATEGSSSRFNRHSLRSRKLVPWRHASLSHLQPLQPRSNNIGSKRVHPEILDGEQMCDSVVDLRKLDVSSSHVAARRFDPAVVLPAELMVHIFGLLGSSSIANCAFVSKRWNQITQCDPVWKTSFLRRYRLPSALDPPPRLVGGLGTGPISKRGQQFQNMYQARRAIEQNWKNQNVKAIYFNGHTDSVYCCQFDEDKLITGSRDKTIRVWCMKTFKCLRVIGGPQALPIIDSNDQPLPTHVTATVGSLPSVNGTPEGSEIFHTPTDYHSASILCLQYDSKLLVTGSSDFTCLVWDVNTFEPIARLRHHTAGVLDVCMDDRYIISCSKDSKICVWSRQTYRLLHTLIGHSGPVNAVQLRGDLLASASGDGYARLWNLDSMTCLGVYQSEQRGLATVEFSNDGRYILTGGNDQVIYKFDVQTGRCVHVFEGHTKLVRSLFLDSYNGRIVSGSYDQGIRVYDFDADKIAEAEHPTVIQPPLEPTRSTKCMEYMDWTTSWILSTKSDYRRIVATSQDGRALLMDFGYDVKNADLLRETPPELTASA